MYSEWVDFLKSWLCEYVYMCLFTPPIQQMPDRHTCIQYRYPKSKLLYCSHLPQWLCRDVTNATCLPYCISNERCLMRPLCGKILQKRQADLQILHGPRWKSTTFVAATQRRRAQATAYNEPTLETTIVHFGFFKLCHLQDGRRACMQSSCNLHVSPSDFWAKATWLRLPSANCM